MGFFSETFSGLDTGTADQVTTGYDIRYVSNMFVEATQDTGNTDGCVLEIQCSVDNVGWNDSGITITMTSGLGFKNDIPAYYRYFRLKVKTKSTIASTSDVDVQGK